MSENSRSDKSASDSREGLQRELEREAAEGKGGIGDVSENRNLSGSSTWETLPENDADGRGEN